MLTLRSLHLVLWLALAPPTAPCPDPDGDGVCDGPDLCWGFDFTGDDDEDGVCNDLDACLGLDSTGDADGDAICDEADHCLGDNLAGDGDGDGVCADLDLCAGDDALGDADADGSCDDLDLCQGDDRTGDNDVDGLCNDLDLCVGAQALIDSDGDGICDNLDLCLGADLYRDMDGDGICEDLDLCAGDDFLGDSDEDGACDDLDPCLGTDGTGDRDNDGVCDDIDPCDDRTLANLDGCEPVLPVPDPGCSGAVPIYVASRNTGFVRCTDGSINRAFASEGWLLPLNYDPTQIEPYGYATNQCETHQDCGPTEFDACAPSPTGYGPSYAECVDNCDSDADCGAGQACLPPAVGWQTTSQNNRSYRPGHPLDGRGQCVPAGCSENADCASGECGYNWNHVACTDIGQPVLYCRTSTDACARSSDCPDNWSWGEEGVCRASSARWTCGLENTTCGRPLTDEDGVWRTAPTCDRSDWLDAATPRLAGLDPSTRAELADHWRQIGALEHASVASFARHVLELLTLGAPAELIADACAAQADEVAHARLAFGLASAFAGAPMGPGPLDPRAMQPRHDPADILRALIDEGCVGETAAAAEAALCAARAEDPLIAAIYARIARDETRHAALAWKTVRWLLAARPELVQVAHETFATHDDRAGLLPPPGPLAAHGVLTGSELRTLRAEVLRDVLRPLAGLLPSTRLAA